jgi:ABC-type multidrug transport system ATPase subunit
MGTRPSEPLLEAHALRFAFRHGRRRGQVLADVRIVLRRGEIVALTGENGSGKTTLLRIFAGLLAAQGGTIARAGRLGYCPQQALVFDNLTVAENFEYFAPALDIEDWRSAMRPFLERIRFAQFEETLVAEVSGGTKQKLNLALALLGDPDLLLLDEPYAGLDWETYQLLWGWVDELRARDRSLLVVSHLVHERDRFDRIETLRGGRLCLA